MNRSLHLVSALLLTAGLGVAACSSALAAPVLVRLGVAPTTVGRYQKIEFAATATGTVFTNPYDFDVATGGALLRATFTAPSGAVKVVDGFWRDAYTLTNTTTGALTASATQNSWRVRFAPTEIGTWTYSLTLQDGSGTSPALTGSFAVTTSTDPGFVRRLAGTNYLRFDAGTPYLPVGENLCWGNNNRLGDYKVWLDQLALNRANCIRIWLCYWGMELEWKNIGYGGYNGLRRYAQASAFELDWILDYCATRGIYVEMCLNNHGQFAAGGDTPQWANNPYNAANGGPCVATQPWNFFSNVSAKATYKNKLRYMVARYGYSKNLLAWEFFNEMDLIDGYATASVKTATSTWISEMASYLKATDPNQHLVSNSYAMSNGDVAVWNNANIDFTQTHLYRKQADLEAPLAAASTALRTAHNKPYLTGEFGLEIYHNAQTNTNIDDPNAIHFRTTMWASALNGSMGPGLTWWWDDYIHPRANLTYPVMKAVDTFLDANVNPTTHAYQPTTLELTTTSGGTLTFSPSFNGFQPPAYAATPAPASTFVVGTNGTLTPMVASLSTMLFGAFHAAARRAPTFQVTYPTAGQVQITVAGRGASSTSTLVVKVDGVTLLTQLNPVANATYAVNVPAGAHTVTLDNTGNEWIQLAAVAFTNLGTQLTGQALRAGNRLVGYVRNVNYTWLYYFQSNQVAPAATSPGRLTVRNLVPGASYTYTPYSALTGVAAGAVSVVTASAAGVATVTIPATISDFAFVFRPNGAARPAAPTAPAGAEAAALQVELWPNPATSANGVTVALPDAVAGPVRYELLDQLGRVCRAATDATTPETARQQQLSLAGLPTGPYFLRVSTATAQRSVRLMVNE
jgi:hypothetical protein